MSDVGRKEEEAHFAAMAVKAEQAFKDVFLTNTDICSIT